MHPRTVISISHMRTYLQRRSWTPSVIRHPETAYWVSFDIDVPTVYLPTPASFHDLWILAEDEERGDGR